jgi:NADH-quinone oxidoreductase subunit C
MLEKENQIKAEIEKFQGAEVKVLKSRRISVRIDADKGYKAAEFLKELTFIHLASIEYVDWIEDNEFELVYNLWSYDKKVTVFLKIRIPRDNPKYKTFMDLWPVAITHEREAHEMMGIVFEGNPNLPLFIFKIIT